MLTQAPPMTLAEYLDYDDGTDTRYELVNGERVEGTTAIASPELGTLTVSQIMQA